MTPESEEYTGPPIGEPPVHVHDNAPVTEALEDALEETDELVAQVNALETVSATRHAELLERINTCQTRLEMISSAATSENPLLTQIVSQLAEVKAELISLKSSTDTRSNLRELSVSQTEILTDLDALSPERSTVEAPGSDVENPTPKEQRKRRFV